MNEQYFNQKPLDSTCISVQYHKKFFIFSLNSITGESANAVPHYQKLCSRDSHIWGIRRGQHNRSAMAEPRPGWTTFLIMVSPLPGKYELYRRRQTDTWGDMLSSIKVSHHISPVPTQRTLKRTLTTALCSHEAHEDKTSCGHYLRILTNVWFQTISHDALQPLVP